MPTPTATRLAIEDGPALLSEINALISGWDASRPAKDLIAELSQRLLAAHIVLDGAVAATESMLLLEPLKDCLAVCRCLTGRVLSSARIASITPSHGSSLGRLIGCWR
jgi:hypothetical protein